MRHDRHSHPIAALGILCVLALAVHIEGKSRKSLRASRDEDVPGARSPVTLVRRGGLTAVSPLQIPMAGWKDILWRTWAQMGEDRLLAVAAGVVFYGLLAMFPAMTAMVSSYGLFADGATIGGHLAFAAAMLPGGAYDIVQEQVARIVAKSNGALGLAFAFGVAIAIWSANAGMKAMIDALNVAYDETEKRSFVMLNLVSLGMTLAVLIFMLVAIGAVVAVPLALDWIGLTAFTESLIALFRWPLMFVVLSAALSALYRFGPSRPAAGWRWVATGSFVAAAIWILASAGFSFYLSNFADYDATYGSLGATIGLMMWLWVSAIIVLFGAELNAEIEHQTALDFDKYPAAN